MIEVIGKEGITARIIADSINKFGNRMITYEIEYPRFIHSELMTHRMLSKNAASSRAIPVKTALDLIEASPAMPVHWGENQAGMQAKSQLIGLALEAAKQVWLAACKTVVSFARVLNSIGLHKQISNRVTEPWQRMKTIVSGTEWENFFYLRNHPDAQPEFQELARVMHEARLASVPVLLQPGEWHLPYVTIELGPDGMQYSTSAGESLSLEDARIISAACCAQVSYRKMDDTLEKAQSIFKRLIESVPAHASPVEHQATPMHTNMWAATLEPGVTHTRRNGTLWSGNLQGWIQFRQTLPNEAKW